MKRSGLFVALLMSVFIFQSLWNVASAYCGHENTSRSNPLLQHFGHHLPASEQLASTPLLSSMNQDVTVQDVAVHDVTVQDVKGQDVTDIPLPLSLQDHHDHLPSCFHVLLHVTQQQLDLPLRLKEQQSTQQYDWSNFYQSPHLLALNPPPLFSPLSVG